MTAHEHQYCPRCGWVVGQPAAGAAPAEPLTDLSAEITAYLASGGLVNPELAKHDAVRDLLIRCRAALDSIGRDARELADFGEKTGASPWT